jgi:hypothetical protein
MGYRRVPTIHTLDDIEGEPGLEVRVKSIPFGKVRRLLRLLDDETSEVMEEISAQLGNALVSWNLEDEDGPVPATLEAIEEQDFSLVMSVVNSWLSAITGVSDDLGKDSPSGPQFPGQPVTMEAL